jgi:hypothetical protein
MTRKGEMIENLPVAGDSVNLSIVSPQRNVKSDDSVASLDQVEVVSRNVSL